MMALLLGLQLAAAAPPALGPIGKQAMPASGCAAFLWSAAGDRALVAMAVANPPHIRLAIDGAAPGDIGWTSGEGAASFGFMPTASYKAGDVTATLTMTTATRRDLTGGATVPQGTLTVERPGRDTVVLPVAGLIGCVQ